MRIIANPPATTEGGGMVLVDQPDRLGDAVVGNAAPAYRQLAEQIRARCREERDRIRDELHRLQHERDVITARLETATASLVALRGSASRERAERHRFRGDSVLDRLRPVGTLNERTDTGVQAAYDAARSEILELRAELAVTIAEIDAYPQASTADLERHKDRLLEEFERAGNEMLDKRSAAHGGRILDAWIQEWEATPRPELVDITLQPSDVTNPS